ncbi:hypothetical protein ACTWPT_26950 [Nonomuraea sp. 3N208]|uniref:hypothetical protein n=1 Tax=Nonomuraea sp. 3N208 TaxID=3457421 RepID=UPI003FD06304
MAVLNKTRRMDNMWARLALAGRRGNLRRGVHALIALWVLTSIAGCELPWLSSLRLEVDAAAVREVGAIGEIVARTTEELEYKKTIQVVDILIVDVGKNTFPEALDSARDQLQRRGWTNAYNSQDLIRMTSPKWEKVSLTAMSLNMLEPFHIKKPEIAKAFKENEAGPHVYLLIDLTKLE